MSATRWLVPVLVALLVFAAIGVSYSVHKTRHLTDQSQRLQRQLAALESEWSQLLLEHSTWGSYARVERLAREELGMTQPETNQRVLVRP